MKNYNLYFILIFIFIFQACEKDVEVDVDTYDPKLVVEAKLSNRTGDAVVYLTQSLPLNNTTPYPKVSDAEVKITALETNEVFWLNEVEEGVYKNETLTGQVGFTYKLDILLPNGENYSSIDVMPEPVEFEDITYEYLDISFDDEDDTEYFEIQPEFLDIDGVENFYQLVIFQEGKVVDEINVLKDLGFDGLRNTQRMVIEANYGDELSFDLHNISATVYDYLLGVEYNLNQGSATPTNPVSNISGDALGYFKAYTADNPITIVLEETE